MNLTECTKTGKRISMNRLLLAEDSKKNRVVYNFDNFIGPKVEITTYDEEALEGDKGHSYVYPRNPMNHHYYHGGAEELDNYRNDKAKLLVGKKFLIKERFSNSGRVVKITNCVHRNDGIDLDYYFWEIDYVYLNEFVTEFAPKKEKKKEKKDTDSGVIVMPGLLCILINILTIIFGILTTFWGAIRYSSLEFFTCSLIANFIVLVIELECFLRLDNELEKNSKRTSSTLLEED